MDAGDQQPEKSSTPFLLLVIGEPHTPEQRELLLPRIIREISTWDNSGSGCDLDSELQVLAAKAPVGEDGQSGEKIIEYQSDLVRIEVLINPTLKCLNTRIRSFLLAPTTYRHLVYAGLVLRDTGCWVLQDGVFAAHAFSVLLRSSELSNAAKLGNVVGTICVTAQSDGDWSESFLSRAVPHPLVLRLNHEAAGSPSSGFVQFGAYISSFVRATPLSELLPTSGVVGNIRFTRPTIYVFPGGEGDSALFGVSGFSLMVDGGFARRSCFWDFARHLDRIDAMLVTHSGADNVFGLASFAERKARDAVHPEIGHVFMNAPDTPRHAAVDGDSGLENGQKAASLVVNVADEAQSLADNFRKVGLVMNKCFGSTPTASGLPPINLYHKVGHGSLDLYVLNPTHDSRALKEFLAQWSRNGGGFGARGGQVPLANAASVCALLVWRPSSPMDTITRILFPGTLPQTPILEALDKMKSVSYFQHASCTERSLSSKGNAVPRKQPPAKANAPSSGPAQKPASLGGASKSDKPEASEPKKMPTARTAKDAPKATSPTKPIAKEVKKADSAHSKPPADSKSLHIKPEETAAPALVDVAAASEKTSSPEATPSQASGDLSPPAVAEEPAPQPLVAESPQASSDGVPVADLLDLQSVPDPVHTAENIAEDHQDVDAVHEPVAESPSESPFLTKQPESPEKVDDDKDIDTTELPADDSIQSLDTHSASEKSDLFEHGAVPAGSNNPFNGEQPESLPAPAAVVDENLLVRHDSLDDVSELSHQKSAESTEAMPMPADVGTFHAEDPGSVPVPTNVDLFNLEDLSMGSGGQPSTNPFFGISTADPIALGSEPEALLFTDLPPNPVECEQSVTSSAKPRASGNLERDSLERDMMQSGGHEFDPQTAWGHPMSLPAPNKPPGGKSDGAGAAEKKKATSPTKPAGKQAAATGAKYQPKREEGKDEAEGATGGDAPAKHPVSSAGTKKGRPTTAPGDSSSKAETKTEPPKSARMQPAKKTSTSATPAKSMLKPVVPFYVDLAYIPCHGSVEFVGFDFFRRVRARYYVLSTVNPDPEVLDALLDAKGTWEDADAEVTIIPTYDADVLRFWMGAHRDQLSQARIDVAPSANRCTIQLQDHDTGCSAYRLEF